MDFTNKGLGRNVVIDERDSKFLLKSALPEEKSDRTFRYWNAGGWWGDQRATPHCIGYSWAHWVEDGPCCVEKDTPILCGDLIWRKAHTLVEGQEIIAPDEYVTNTKDIGKRDRKLRTAFVTNNEVKKSPLLEIVTDSGYLKCTPDHPLLARRKYSDNSYTKWQWVEAKNLDKGSQIQFFVESWEGGSLGKSCKPASVFSINKIEDGEIASLSTSTKTYIANGFISHNTHKGNAPIMNPDIIYHEAQKVDQWPGNSYQGTSVRAGAKVLQTKGFIESYLWAWDVKTIVKAILEKGPVVVGTNWYESMYKPDADFKIAVKGDIVGGHAYILNGVNVENELLRMKNSWGRRWGKNGYSYISFADMDKLMHEQGEACLAIELKPELIE